MCSQFAGRFGLEVFRGDGCSSAVGLATRDSNSESRACIGGRLGIWVGWTPKLGGLRGDEDSLPWMEGSLVCGGEDCASVGVAAGAAISSAAA